MDDMNLLAIAVAAIAYFALGAVWFTVLSKPWAEGIGSSVEQIEASATGRNMAAVFGWNFVIGLVMFFVIAYVISSGAQADGWQDGVRWALSIALIVELARATAFLFEERGIKIWLIYAGYTFIGFGIGGAIIGGWQ